MTEDSASFAIRSVLNLAYVVPSTTATGLLPEYTNYNPKLHTGRAKFGKNDCAGRLYVAHSENMKFIKDHKNAGSSTLEAATLLLNRLPSKKNQPTATQVMKSYQNKVYNDNEKSKS